MGKMSKKKQLKQTTIPPLKQKTIPPFIRVSYLSGAWANVIIVGVIIAAWILMKYDPHVYYVALQEDQIIEWMSFWAFFIAAILFTQAAYRQYVDESRIPWFLLCVGVFCFFVAMEEISWAQRLFGYRPPAYFLEQNFQQEFNFHNVVDTDLRILVLQVVILGFGIVLPVVWMIPAIRRLCSKATIVPPPVFFAPAFLATFCLYEIYPWQFSGELVELMLGLGFVFSALALTSFFRKPNTGRRYSFLYPFTLVGAVVIFSVVMTFISDGRLSNQPELLEVARKELIALGKDYREALQVKNKRITSCKLHNRVFAHVKKHGIKNIYNGNFRDLTQYGLPEARAQFFIDPWNTAYWIRHECDPKNKRVQIIVYSFGPNRRRDSNPFEISGDDIGVTIFESGFEQK